MDAALGLLAVIGLITANGYFVLGEFAYVATRREQIEGLAREGDRRADAALRVLRRLSFMLSGAQLGITVTSLLVGFIAEPVFAALLRPVLEPLGLPERAVSSLAITIGFVLSTTAQMVFGELAPKNLGIARPESFALSLGRSTLLWLTVAGPLIRVFDGAANRLLRAIGVEPVEEIDGGVSAEELGYIVAESSESGVLTPEQAQLLQRVLELRQRHVVETMVPRNHVDGVEAATTCDELRRKAIETGHSRFPVYGDSADDILGVVQARDILGVPRNQRSTTTVSTLVAPALVVPESAECGRLLSDLRRQHASLAVVVDEYGGIAGIVTLEDLVEELVGPIRDEYDPEEPVLEPVGDREWRVPGLHRPDEVEHETGVRLPLDGDFETLSGLIMDRLGRVPRLEDRVEIPLAGTEGGRAELVVDELDGYAVAFARLRLLDGPQPPTETGSVEGGHDVAVPRGSGATAAGAVDGPDEADDLDGSGRP